MKQDMLAFLQRCAKEAVKDILSLGGPEYQSWFESCYRSALDISASKVNIRNLDPFAKAKFDAQTYAWDIHAKIKDRIREEIRDTISDLPDNMMTECVEDILKHFEVTLPRITERCRQAILSSNQAVHQYITDNIEYFMPRIETTVEQSMNEILTNARASGNVDTCRTTIEGHIDHIFNRCVAAVAEDVLVYASANNIPLSRRGATNIVRTWAEGPFQSYRKEIGTALEIAIRS
jgi:hypothetical protein